MCLPKRPGIQEEKESKKINTSIAKEDAWVESVDLEAFCKDIHALGKELEMGQGEEDVRHLNKMIMWSNTCAMVGIVTMGFGVNPITIFALSIWNVTRWTMIAHHVCHGGYDKCHPNKSRWNRFKFAVGSSWRRICDWLDWMMPEAWNIEHNNRHHYYLCEKNDPDLAEDVNVWLRELQIPLFLKHAIVAVFITIWKWAYYAPNTYKELKLAGLKKAGKPIPKVSNDHLTLITVAIEGTPFYSLWELLIVSLLPYFAVHFILLPLPFIFLGEFLGNTNMYWNAVVNLLLAEMLTNVHSFVVVVPNHTGDDMYRYKNSCRPYSGSFYLRQISSSVNFQLGTDLIDFMHGFLNYQIEHHLWPSLSMRSYQKAAPRVKELCKKHGVPYVQENVFRRAKKTLDIMCGTTSMRWFPEEYETKFLEVDAVIQKKH